MIDPTPRFASLADFLAAHARGEIPSETHVWIWPSEQRVEIVHYLAEYEVGILRPREVLFDGASQGMSLRAIVGALDVEPSVRVINVELGEIEARDEFIHDTLLPVPSSEVRAALVAAGFKLGKVGSPAIRAMRPEGWRKRVDTFSRTRFDLVDAAGVARFRVLWKTGRPWSGENVTGGIDIARPSRSVSIQHDGKTWHCIVESTGLFSITVDGVEGHDWYVDEDGSFVPFDIVEGNEDKAFEALRVALGATT